MTNSKQRSLFTNGENTPSIPPVEKPDQVLVAFLKENRVCGKWVCTTCGGTLLLAGRLEDHLTELGIDTVTALCEVAPTEIVTIEHWVEILEVILHSLLPETLKTVIFDTWRQETGVSTDFDLFVLKYAAPDGFLRNLEGENWISQLLFSSILEKKPIYEFLCKIPGIEQFRVMEQFQVLLNILERYQLNTEIQQWDDWKLKYPDQAILLEKQAEETRRNQADYKQKELERSRAELEKKQLREAILKKKVEKISELSQEKRLNGILEDNMLDLDSTLFILVDSDVMELSQLTSPELTHLISGLTKKMKGMPNNLPKAQWRDLRSRLTILRQSVMQREYKAKLNE